MNFSERENPHLFRLQRIARRVTQGGRLPGMKVVEKGKTPDKDTLEDSRRLRWNRSSIAFNLKGGDVVIKDSGEGLGFKVRPMTPRESRR